MERTPAPSLTEVVVAEALHRSTHIVVELRTEAPVLAAGNMPIALPQLLGHPVLFPFHGPPAIVSFAHAAKLAGVSREDLVRHARAVGIQPRWSQEMVAEELA